MTTANLQITHLIHETIKFKDPKAEVILFGSQAREDAHFDSDWDILILLDMQHVSRSLDKEYKDLLYNIELEIGQPISSLIFSKTDWESKHKFSPLYNNIKREGIYLS